MPHLSPGETPHQSEDSRTVLTESQPGSTSPDTTTPAESETLSPQETLFAARLVELDLKRQRLLKAQQLQNRMRLLIFTLATVLIVSGFGFIIYSTSVDYRHSTHAFATVQAQWTQNVVNTAQARSQGTANAINTVQANINATATAQDENQAQATTTIEDMTATATALEGILTDATKKDPDLNDSLSDRTGDGKWDIGGSSTTGCAFTSSGYHAFVAKRGYIQPCLSQAKTYADAVYSAQVTINTGNADRAGLLFRVDSTGNQYYFFSIGMDGTYSLDLYQESGPGQNLLNGRNADITQGLGQSNQLVVLAQGTTFYLFANDTFLGGASDSTLKSGRLGVAVVQSGIPIDASFSNVKVWKL
ncbi:hypothetical protein [Ktedonobacter robiniae]|uniref:hypothetical protein n=1 Tax=Ktedonobacter robiniae TaxID=2778365 RepID=UPI00191677EF|nr:hypothetical protein [Ktedonobacter robiniae]